jgi:hypothetical protein
MYCFFHLHQHGYTHNDYLLDYARNQHGFLIRNQQDGHLQLYNTFAECQVRLEQAKVTIAAGA